ncbi:alpha/beta hydrolase [Caballeronia hypogeia]|uniref:Alpha/beta hydrolase n=1 Tax=Caballeronia hypogeia TaxID=1777140 RepID=A0A158D2L9_9BURK|nr:alpha/beta hydrolase [Caballeronia hypogeia]SAK88905.1 alpha/beta hydrolase [Caballeronia hypogeia]
MSATPDYIDTAHGEMRVWRAGRGAAVVVLPGLVAAASVVAERLAGAHADTSFHVIELPGIGGSASVRFSSFEDVVNTAREAMHALGLAHAPLLAFDLAGAIALQLDPQALCLHADHALGWAARKWTPPDLTPRNDGTHLNALFSHLRDAHVLDASSGRQVAKSGDPFLSPEAMNATFVAAAMSPLAYMKLWSLCSAHAGCLREAANTRGVSEVLSGAIARNVSPAPRTPGDVWRDYVDIPHGRVHLRLSGPDRDPVIALHSAPGSSAPLMPLLKGLGAKRRVIAPDYIGNGESARPDEPVDIATLARDVIALADKLDLNTFDLWGTHTGALIALETSLLAPDRVRRVVLEAPPILDPSFSADILANYFIDLSPDQWGLHVQKAWQMRRDMFLFWPWYRAERAAGRPLQVPDAAFLHDWTVGLLSSGKTYSRTYRAAFEYDTRERMAGLKCPALFCAGASDMLVQGLDAAREMKSGRFFVTGTPATVWYPDQAPEAVEETIATYARFLDHGRI